MWGIDNVWGEGQYVHYETSIAFATGPGPASRELGCGFMFSPAWLETLPNNPMYVSPFSPLSSDERAAGSAQASGDPAAPVGLGAFRFVSYTPGNGNSFIAERNPDYWRGPNGITGEDLPYLDEIEFVVSADIQGRSLGLRGGQFDIMHTSNADEIAKYERDPDFVTLQANDFGETNYSVMNVAGGANAVLAEMRDAKAPIAMDPHGYNADNPLVHLSCRRSAGARLRRRTLRQRAARRHGASRQRPLPPGSVGLSGGHRVPGIRPCRSTGILRAVQGRQRPEPGDISFSTTNDPFNVESTSSCGHVARHLRR